MEAIEADVHNSVLKLPPDARCLGCGYQLEGLIETRCHECAKTFNPSDPFTFQIGTRRPSWTRLASAPSMVETILVAAFGFFAIWHLSDPAGGGLEIGLLLIPVMYVIAPLWLMRAIAHFISSRKYAVEKHSKTRLRWLALPIVVVLVALAFMNEWPLRLRFAMSKAELDAAAQSAIAGQLQTPCRVGLYNIEHVDISTSQFGTSLVYLRTGWSLIDPAGFLFDPSGRALPNNLRPAPDWTTYED